MRKHLLLYSILLFIALLLSVGYQSVLRYIDVIQYGGLVYKSVPLDEADLAARPVQTLATNLKSGQWRLLEESFSNKATYSRFVLYFQMVTDPTGTLNGGFFENYPLTFAVKGITGQAGKDTKGDYTVTLEIRLYNNPGRAMSLQCLSSYEPTGKQYFIKSITYTGDLVTAAQSAATGVEIPDISKSPCSNASESGFSYIRLPHRKEANSIIEPALVLGRDPNVVYTQIPEDFYSTEAIRQEPFQGFTSTFENPKWRVCSDANPFGDCDALFDRNITHTYYPGDVISQQDASNNEMGQMFLDVSDGDGVLQVPNAQGVLTDYPIGFFLDQQWGRLKVLSSKGERYHYGNGSGNGNFSTPVTLAAVGHYLYVLDAGSTPTLHVFSFGLDAEGKMAVSFKGTSSLGIDLKGASDLAGFVSPGAYILYVANPVRKSITRVLVDPATGYAKAGSIPKEIFHSLSHLGERMPLGEIRKIAVSPRLSAYGKNVLMSLSGDYVNTYSTEGLSAEPVLNLNFQHGVPMESAFRNIGYNQGNGTFIISDIARHKVHIFSGLGQYLGSGGEFGQAEGGEELYYPNVVSSNTFTGDAIEMVVCSQWGQSTGFKRFFPKADIGNIEVIERAPASLATLAEDELSFRFALTSGYQAASVTLKLNGQVIRTLNGSLFANVYAENFLAEASGSNGLKGILKPGWNTYEVELTASVPGPAGVRLPYQRTRRIEFHYTTSVIESNTPLAHDKASHPLVVYKNTFVTGTGSFTLSGGKTIIMPGCTLSVAKGVTLLASQEDFELHCGSNLELYVHQDTLKTFRDCYFNGLTANYNMVSCRGDYTGGKGKGSGASSALEFIGCRFDNYFGRALYLIEGRATVAACIFESNATGNGFLTASAIAVDPGARLDVRGGQFFGNDIALDGNGAEVYIGHSANSYKGTKVANPLFKNNRIALYTFGGHVAIKAADFVDNDAAIVSLNGTVDLSKNSESLFQNNRRAIIFSDVLLGSKGRNRFINSEVDVTYLAPPGKLTATEFDVECNYWEHQQEAGFPSVEVISNPLYQPASDLISFRSIPYLERKESGNGQSSKGHYTCTGGKSDRPSKLGRHQVSDSLPFHAYHTKIRKISQALRQREDVYAEMASLASLQNQPLVLGQYPNRGDTIYSYNQAMVKSILSAYLYRSAKTDLRVNVEHYNKVYAIVKINPSRFEGNQNYYMNATGDKLEFLTFFLGGAGPYTDEQTSAPVAGKPDRARVYPNPSASETKLAFQVLQRGHYSVTLFDGSGAQVSSVLEGQEFREGHHTVTVPLKNLRPGLYYIRLSGSTGGTVQTLKVIKQ